MGEICRRAAKAGYPENPFRGLIALSLPDFLGRADIGSALEEIGRAAVAADEARPERLRSAVDAAQPMAGQGEQREALDAKIAAASQEYALDRISKVERNVLRLGVFELQSELPPKVALSEAIRLCRKFGSPEGADFVNAVLDQIYKN